MFQPDLLVNASPFERREDYLPWLETPERTRTLFGPSYAVLRPAFAALDVTGVEPLPEESPLWHHPKIMLTPHDSSQTNGTILRADGTFVDNLHRYLNGEPLRNLVDRKAFED